MEKQRLKIDILKRTYEDKNIKYEKFEIKFVAKYPITPSIDINGTVEYSKYFHKKKSTTDFITEDGEKSMVLKIYQV